MRITVVGDTLLDEDVEGVASRLSPDAPVPVVEVGSRRSRPGGAGLAAALLRRDGHEVELVTALSGDERGSLLRGHLRGIDVIAAPSGAPTPVKTRLRANGQLVCRVDEGCAAPPPPAVHQHQIEAIAAADAIVVSDYGRGITAHPRIRAALRQRGAAVPLVWDPHPRGADPVPTAELVTPNLEEAAAAAGTPPQLPDAPEAARLLRERYGCAAVLVTLGGHGALLYEEGGVPAHLPASPVDAPDACGAGDRFAATAAAVLARGGDRREAARAAVAAAGAYLSGGGVASLVFPALAGAPAPVGPEADPRALVRAVRARGGTVVATGGCFDILHAGHIRTLEAARALGDCLVVCLNSDASVRRLKGPERPIVGEGDRAEMLRALACVDAVLVFEEDGPERAIGGLRPDVWVKGGDYSPEMLPETRLLESWGGRTVTVPYHPGRSTTRLAAALAGVG